MESKVKERVSDLEAILGSFMAQTEKAIIEMKRDTHSLKEEMKEFKEEMKEFKEEMKEFKVEMTDFKNDMNKKWGELSNKMGTLVEDMVAPNMPNLALEIFNCQRIEHLAVRWRVLNKIDNSKHHEYDIVVICPDSIIVNETKSKAKIEYVDDFIDDLNELHEYFPEAKEKKVIPTFASLYIPENVLKYLTKKKIYAISLNGDTMEVLNLKDIKNKNGKNK
jgi:hypothetical protein